MAELDPAARPVLVLDFGRNTFSSSPGACGSGTRMPRLFATTSRRLACASSILWL